MAEILFFSEFIKMFDESVHFFKINMMKKVWVGQRKADFRSTCAFY